MRACDGNTHAAARVQEGWFRAFVRSFLRERERRSGRRGEGHVITLRVFLCITYRRHPNENSTRRRACAPCVRGVRVRRACVRAREQHHQPRLGWVVGLVGHACRCVCGGRKASTTLRTEERRDGSFGYGYVDGYDDGYVDGYTSFLRLLLVPSTLLPGRCTGRSARLWGYHRTHHMPQARIPAR